jgi:aminomethyltransferase
MTYENNPLELGLGRLVAWDLDDDAAISLPALRRIRQQGVTRRLVGVEFDGDPFPNLNAVKWPVHDAGGGAPIGTVTSAIHTPRLKKNIGYAWLPVAKAEPGTAVHVESEWGPRSAVVVDMPFVDPEKRIPVS